MKLTGISFSLSENSMNYRGLSLMKHWLDMEIKSIIDFNIPLMNKNVSDGIVPKEVELWIEYLKQFDGYVFAVPEYTHHLNAVFRNSIDWIVIKYFINNKLRVNDIFGSKPVKIVTFTPSRDSGGFHLDATQNFCEMNCLNVVDRGTIMDLGWNNVRPGNYDYVRRLCKDITKKFKTQKLLGVDPPEGIKSAYEENKPEWWVPLYEDWNNSWNE